MSDISGAARWLAPAAKAARRNVWLAGVVTLTALLVLGNLANDASLDLPYGWDVRVNCAAVDAHADGLDPYFVKNLKGTTYSYPYLPVTLDVFRPLCAGGVLLDHYRSIFLVLAVLCALLLPGLGRTRASARDAGLKVLCALGAFVGFEFVVASGNFALLSGVLTAIALKLLLRPLASEQNSNFSSRLAGAALLGLVTSFKLVFVPVLAALYFLPLPRGRKLALIAVAAFAFALPLALSRLLYPDLFASWLLAIAGQIPGQHAVGLVESNPSLLLLARDLMVQAGFGDGKPAMLAAYAFAALALVLVLVPFALSVLRAAASGSVRAGASLLTQLDRWLMDHPRTAMRITVLAMFALYLSSPRLKEYAFFELALLAAILIVDLPPLALAAILGIGLAFPALVSLLGAPIEGTFILLVIALICFWIVLLDFRAEPERLEQG
ncbi:hypothetical protein I6F21_16440 [Bradyrhizobium sp. NBAIM03]|uniref:hypothetical protein n=1 Tax=Bradyrhizobium sp. NBAIM03 TaxID=2793816 RepID=UPI001CD24DC4|nr:hypothetical protein [Bradyrhizobium sp. NBAIM03]